MVHFNMSSFGGHSSKCGCLIEQGAMIGFTVYLPEDIVAQGTWDICIFLTHSNTTTPFDAPGKQAF